MKSKRILMVIICIIWYKISVFLITPALIRYIFSQNSIFVDLLSELISIGIPVCFCYVIGWDNDARVEEKGLILTEKSDCVTNNRLLWHKEFAFVLILLSFSLFQVASLYTRYICELVYYMVKTNYDYVNYLNETSTGAFLISIIVYAFLPSIYEELLYRKMIYESLADWPIWICYLVSGILFASAHKGVFNVINAAVIGILLMNVYIKTKSLFLLIAAHCINNIISLICVNLNVLPLSPFSLFVNGDNEVQLYFVMIIYVSIIVLCSCFCYLFMQKAISAYSRMK